jgi:hypothetical protein
MIRPQLRTIRNSPSDITDLVGEDLHNNKRKNKKTQVSNQSQ